MSGVEGATQEPPVVIDDATFTEIMVALWSARDEMLSVARHLPYRWEVEYYEHQAAYYGERLRVFLALRDGGTTDG